MLRSLPLLLLLLASAAPAAEIVVDTLEDGVVADACTLRNAVINAENDAVDPAGGCTSGDGEDLIVFAAGVEGSLLITQGQILIRSSLTIEGPGADRLRLDAGDDSRHFSVIAGDSTISGLSLERGRAERGGAIYVSGSSTRLSLREVRLAHNRAVAPSPAIGLGGALFVIDAQLDLERCTIEQNRAGMRDGVEIVDGGAGGALVAQGQTMRVSLFETRVDRNEAWAGYDGSDAVGIGSAGGAMIVAQGELLVRASSFDRNRLHGWGSDGDIPGFGPLSGGALALQDARVQIENSSFTRNSARSREGEASAGGAIATNGALTELRLVHATISGNDANSAAAVHASGGALRFWGSVVAANPALGSADDIVAAPGSFLTYGGNLFATGAIAPLPGPPLPELPHAGAPDEYADDPRLLALADNGGATPTLALRPGSLAIDRIAGDFCLLSTDQRGAPREGACDAGAYEGVIAQLDLAARLSAPMATAAPAQLLLQLQVSNAGPEDAIDASIVLELDPALQLQQWACIASAGATCPNSTGGSPFPVSLHLAAHSQLDFSLLTMVPPGVQDILHSSVEVGAPAGFDELSASNNVSEAFTAVLVDALFGDGFEGVATLR